MLEEWLRRQKSGVQVEFFRRASHFLSDHELIAVMEGVKNGRELTDIHIELGLLDKYGVDFSRIADLLSTH